MPQRFPQLLPWYYTFREKYKWYLWRNHHQAYISENERQQACSTVCPSTGRSASTPTFLLTSSMWYLRMSSLRSSSTLHDGSSVSATHNSDDSYRVNQYPAGHYEILGYEGTESVKWSLILSSAELRDGLGAGFFSHANVEQKRQLMKNIEKITLYHWIIRSVVIKYLLITCKNRRIAPWLG